VDPRNLEIQDHVDF